MLSGSLGEITCVRQQSGKQNAGSLIVDVDTCLPVHLVDDGAGGAYHLPAHVGNAAVPDVALHMVVYLL